MFKPVSPQVDFPKQEKEILEKWQKEGIIEKYLNKNKNSKEKFSFLDGPITANNPMGVHHAWGRTYKDFWQRFFNMRGRKQRFQNGFDEQGLWVEVEVEKELGLRSKKDIENLVPDDKFKSLEKFINLCKERVKKFSAIQTEQSKRLGYFMDWDNSYHTSSDENNYAIWNFLKVVSEKGWIYKGRDSVPWCPRCGTAISQHEILTEEYKQLTHASIYFKLPIIGREKEFLLVWTTTPWTIPANVAVAVNKEEKYCGYKTANSILWLMEKRINDLKKKNILPEEIGKAECKKGSELVGWEYEAPFDELERVKKILDKYRHRVVAGDDRILPVGSDEGTGLVHMAPGAGAEDFQLGKKEKLPVIDVIDEAANYLEDLGEFSGKSAKKHPEIIIDFLKSKDEGRFLLTTENYTHRYPTCWRCKTELVWRVVDEWYIAMDKPSSESGGETFRKMMIGVARKINWLPKWGLERELDWLSNMHDWLISKKRYWGLALPIWECEKCKSFTVIGGCEELKEKAIEGFEEFKEHSPHRPWIDLVKIKCEKCGGISSRVSDVGNPWLDAGIVPFSTMSADWFPADFITESFPGQFKNWFYALIAMSTGLKNENPAKTILGFASVVDEKGEEMHKSKGNAIEFNEAADKIGVDVMRWLYLGTNPEHNVSFGFRVTDEVRRLFHLRLWNVYSFFVMYANVDNWTPVRSSSFAPLNGASADKQNILDRWIISRMNGSIKNMTKAIERYDAADATGLAEVFIINDLSNWYVRRIRDRVGPTAEDNNDKNEAYQTLWTILTTYSRVLAPFIPFMADEIYTNLTGEKSVHLSEWPAANELLIDKKLEEEMEKGIEVSSIVNAARKLAGVKVRIPIKNLSYKGHSQLDKDVEGVVLSEVNVYKLIYKGKSSQNSFSVEGDLLDFQNQDLIAGKAREIIRKIQEERKKLGTNPNEKIDVILEEWPSEFEEEIKRKTLIASISKGNFLVKRHGQKTTL